MVASRNLFTAAPHHLLLGVKEMLGLNPKGVQEETNQIRWGGGTLKDTLATIWRVNKEGMKLWAAAPMQGWMMQQSGPSEPPRWSASSL